MRSTEEIAPAPMNQKRGLFQKGFAGTGRTGLNADAESIIEIV
jgi:hypothetical protein